MTTSGEPSGSVATARCVRARSWCGIALVVLACACGDPPQTPAEVPFDRLDLVLRMSIEPGGGPEEYVASDDGSRTWVEAFATPDRGSGIFLARARVTVRMPEEDSGELLLEDLAVRLVTDEYTESGWLRGARLTFLGEGRATLDERLDEASSLWRVVHMPSLVLRDATETIEGTFHWTADAPTEAVEPHVSLITGEQFPHVYVHFVSYHRQGPEADQ